MAHPKPIHRAEKIQAVRDFLNSSVVPPYAYTKRVRDLSWAEARDIVFGLSGVSFQLDDSVADHFTAKRDTNGDIVVTPLAQPATGSATRAGNFGIRPDTILGVPFVYIDKFSSKGDIQKTIRHGHISNLDPRFLVMLTWLCERVKNQGGTVIYHLGFVGDALHNPNDAHNWGRAFDFAGVGGIGGLYDVTVLKHWGMQPVTMPVDWGPVDRTTKKHKYQKGEEYPQWPDHFEGTTYRLDDPPKGRFIPHVPYTDEFTGGPTWNAETERIIACSMFREVYDVAASEGKDTDNPHDPPTTIGSASRYIIHPDHRSTKLRKHHKDHIHMQVGPTVHVGFWAS
jgi:hypothetical protein